MFHARDGAIFSKNSTFVFFDGASPITENGIQLRSPSPIMAPAGTDYKIPRSKTWPGYEADGILKYPVHQFLSPNFIGFRDLIGTLM